MVPVPPAVVHLTAGDLLHLTSAASVQFVKPIMFRLIRVLDRPTFDGWLWLDGYQLNKKGDATTRRELFVQQAGLRKLPTPAPTPRRGGRQADSRPPGQPPLVRRDRD
ncbi:hypothetical protein CA850_21105 [Micromonospora echinospora]|uniref:hypothetical protein n=1 Tax=Micromonospora echinospora TaxID=1877 RepID=UPI000B5ACDA2|nr:hypothetical protein [Micromonospora echinospora]OZV77895.1 hypothetical protein CA850_21105 [Micromonospora echinospora]